MADERYAHIRRALVDVGATAFSLVELCAQCAALVMADGATIVLLADDALGAVASSNDRSAELADLQFSLGQGPTPDATASAEPALSTNLAGVEALRLWPQFAPAATELGVLAVFTFPLLVGAIRLGVLSFDCSRPGALDPDHLRDALVVADVVTDLLLVEQAGSDSNALSVSLDDAARGRASVHQATGMVAAQLDCTMRDALVRLRAQAFAGEQTTQELAWLVVNRQVRFDPGSG